MFVHSQKPTHSLVMGLILHLPRAPVMYLQVGDNVSANYYAVEPHHGPWQDCTLVSPQGGQNVKRNNVGQARMEHQTHYFGASKQ